MTNSLSREPDKAGKVINEFLYLISLRVEPRVAFERATGGAKASALVLPVNVVLGAVG